MNYLLLSEGDVQLAFAEHLKEHRKKAKMSREALAKKSTVPASTIKKFEVTGLISFRQLLLLWQSLDDLTRLYELTKAPTQGKNAPTSIAQVLNNGL
ncbi:helix-turn-helix transcriptional regulator [Pseudoalteromonas sp. SA25]|uniref:helix-turn-helix transcriptional regulator n=1 Tax=Pseudoalteromonas sp. SA25 TaxID=2686347 RepID=UPI0013FD3BAA